MLRRFTSERELIRPAITTSFFTLQHMHKNKTNLRKTLTSEEWTRSGQKRHCARKTKEAIAKTFGENEDKYKEIFEIIDKRRESQLHQPLHAKGYYLNPEYFYSNKNIEQDEEVMTSSYQVMQSKKKNRLAQQRLNDLVFVKYNRSLKRKYDARRRVDPISLKEIDDSNEWLMGQMQEELNRDELVFKDDNLTWNMVGEATGAYEDAYNTRTGKRRKSKPTPKEKGKAYASPTSLRICTPLYQRKEEYEDEYEENVELEEKHQEDEAIEDDEEDFDDILDLDRE
uniref:Uncharacterized protein n=1 Tax=Manihot esculenta TaxID=3983 RepID=A0A2C9UB49_MANES